MSLCFELLYNVFLQPKFKNGAITKNGADQYREILLFLGDFK